LLVVLLLGQCCANLIYLPPGQLCEHVPLIDVPAWLLAHQTLLDQPLPAPRHGVHYLAAEAVSAERRALIADQATVDPGGGVRRNLRIEVDNPMAFFLFGSKAA
jgi:hypothetical protein